MPWVKRTALTITTLLGCLGGGGCFGWPAIAVRESTFSDSPASRYLYALSALGSDYGERDAPRWFAERCAASASNDVRDCAKSLGFSCQDIPGVECYVEAYETTRRTDRGAPLGARNWMTVHYKIIVSRSRSPLETQVSYSAKVV